MIRVSIDPRNLAFRLDGHAGYAPEGQDIVCASASMLAAMMFEYVLRHTGDSDLGTCEMTSGHAELDVCPERTDVLAACINVFEAAKCGFELLAKHYPDNVIID